MGSRLSPAMVATLRDLAAGEWLCLSERTVTALVIRGLAVRRGIPKITDAGREALAKLDQEKR